MDKADAIIAPHAHRIGEGPILDLARELGVTVAAIYDYCERHGLPNPLRPARERPRRQAAG